MLKRFYRTLVPENLKVLELGSGYGDLLAVLKPETGVGVDFSVAMVRRAARKHPAQWFVCADIHALPVKGHFDIIVLSDIINDLWDVHTVLCEVRHLCHPDTRIILNCFNNLWRVPIFMARALGRTVPFLEQSWFTPADIDNLLDLSGWEQIKIESAILLPINVPVISALANRFLAKFPPFSWCCITNFIVARPGPQGMQETRSPPLVSVIIPAKNEAGNIKDIFQRTFLPGHAVELIFVEGHSTDNTYAVIQETIDGWPAGQCRLLRQPGKGKADAIRSGFDAARGDVLAILDADLSVPPEYLPRFVDTLVSAKGEFINGVRLVYPMEGESMRFLNMVGNKFFSVLFTWLLGQPVKDTLCGTKVFWKKDYERMKELGRRFGKADPFGDFDLLFGASALNLKIVDMPVRYCKRRYGKTNIKRWKHGWILLKMAAIAARRIKFMGK
ncbi:MAG: bifunctional class I SAM-dependent methyltransferase/glycosyltransferase family 2 protein [Thermodesulfobacteriota bacterium]|nr:bifunctional class I SAM-dependent methyltransferase/glycosyltransferase family 2 protein [Thermodesulfobacteriota bacterium]